MQDQYDVPVLLVIFNRKEKTRQLINAIRQVRPLYVYVSADGPREGYPNDVRKCAEARALIDTIDWPCKVSKRFLDKNIGLGLGVSTAIDWLFRHVEQGIILEEDCVPSISFFKFCRSTLNKYADNPEIMHINGNNFHSDKDYGKATYYFSRYMHCWGWATWRRAWEYFKLNIPDFPQFVKDNKLEEVLPDLAERAYWFNLFEKMYQDKLRTVWSYSWMYTIWKNDGLAIYPNKNLVTNIGIGEDATHTAKDHRNLLETPIEELPDIKHPDAIEVNLQADRDTFDRVFRRHPVVTLYQVMYYLVQKNFY